MTFKSINLISSVKTGEVVVRKDDDGNWVYLSTVETKPADAAQDKNDKNDCPQLML